MTEDTDQRLRLATDNQRLREQLRLLRERAVATEALSQRNQEWELELLGVGPLDRLLRLLTDGIRARFALDGARLLLIDPDCGLRGLLARMGQMPEQFEQVLFVDARECLPPSLRDLVEPRVGPLDAGGDLAPLFDPGDPPGSVAIMPLWRGQRYLGILGLRSQDAERYAADLETHFVRRLAAICAVCLENAVNRARLEIGGLTDPLTGLHNRRSLELRLGDELERARRQRQPLSCLFLDLDRFKQINDAHGHASGDAVLIELARRLRATLRVNDIAARFGGDEFAVLLPATDAAEALQLARRIRAAVGCQPFVLGDELAIPLTVSIGIGAARPHATADDREQVARALFRQADEALYAAKRAGRDRVSGP